MKFLENLFQLFYPKTCITCEKTLFSDEKIICIECRHDLPIICYTDFEKNNTSEVFKGKVEIYKAVSFLSYKKEGKTKELIHYLKYKNQQVVGSFLGNWFGRILKESHEFDDLFCVVPVPLHPSKYRKRGYNQLTLFGKRLSEHLNTSFQPDVLTCKKVSKTQTKKNRLQRYKSANTRFYLEKNNLPKNIHVLLIDDVITTGATLVACCKELLKIEGIKISIATISITE